MAVKCLGIAVFAAMLVFALVGCKEEEESPPPPHPVASPPAPTNAVVNIAAIKGVIAPAYTLTPVTTIKETEQYSGTVTWNGNPNISVFDKNTKYTATITLTAKTGFTLQGVAENFFTVAGATSVSNAADSGVITAEFSETDSKIVNGIAVKTQPTRLTYMYDNTLDLTGLEVTLTYDDKSTSDVTVGNFPFKSITTDPAQGDKLAYYTHDGRSIKITYGKIECETNRLTINRLTPIAADFNISGLTQSYDGSSKTVTITPKEGKSSGYITVKYNGSTTAPSSGGTYTVTFDVSATTNYNAVNGLSAGTMTIKVTPTAADFNISGLTQDYDGSSKTVTIMPKEGKSNGIITVKYNGSTSAPSNAGTYNVTFDVTATTIYNAVNGLSAGTLKIFLIQMVQIPGGSFDMGEERVSFAQPVHKVTLSSFYMGKYEVTQEQYQVVMGTNPSGLSDNPQEGEIQGKRPVENLSWYEALVFCNKLSVTEGLSPAYSINGSTNPADWGTAPLSYEEFYASLHDEKSEKIKKWDTVVIVSGSTGYRLPTEAQWEYAARGGNGSPGNYKYSGSNNIDDVAWWNDQTKRTHEVGKKAPNGLGLYDMSGNVKEWCWDWFGEYTSAEQMNPTGPATGRDRVVRGGDWNYSERGSTARWCYSFYVSSTFSIGFRVVRP